MDIKEHLVLDPAHSKCPTRDHPEGKVIEQALPLAKATKLHPIKAGGENARLFFVGNATTILEWEGTRLMTDPNFLHAGDHVHLGPGVTSKRVTNPALDLHDVPHIDLICLSHYHEDHFDREVEASLRRDLPIISTPHAKTHLHDKKPAEEQFTAVTALDTFESAFVEIETGSEREERRAQGMGAHLDRPAMLVTAMPGKHVPQGVLGTLNDLLGAVPPTNGWIIELGYFHRKKEDFECGYRIYISGDTLLVDELRAIPDRYTNQGKPIDLMLAHLGGTTIPSRQVPLVMVTMDVEQGLQLIRLVQPDLTVPIHYDDYDIMTTSISDFQKVVDQAGMSSKVVYLDRGDDYKFRVRAPT